MTRWGATGTDYAAATPHHLATQAAAEAMSGGGTAADGAISAAAVLAVVYPNQCSVGGDVIALLAEPGRAPVTVNGSGAAPFATDVAAVRRRHAGQMPWYGPDTVTVPGAVSAWAELHRRGGATRWSELLEPARTLAAEGTVVAPGLGRALGRAEQRLRADEGLAEVFLPGGRLLETGDVLVQPRLAESLAALAEDGSRAMYGGWVGSRLVEGLRALGSAMTPDDLVKHACEVVEPLTARHADAEVSVAPPNSQGLVLLQVLGALDAAQVGDPLGTDADLLTALFAVTAAERDRALADPRVAPTDVEALLARKHLVELVGDARRLLRVGASPGRSPRPSPTGDTVAVVTADRDGRFVSLIQSVYLAFGSGLLEPRTGIVLHDRGACFTLDPSSPNVLRAGARPAHTLMPVLVSRDGVVVAAHGTRGGEAQPQIHAQLVLQLGTGADPEEAVSRPRWVLDATEDAGTRAEVLVEADLGDRTLTALAGTGQLQRLPARDDAVGHAQIVRATERGLEAGSDPRADGAALAG